MAIGVAEGSLMNSFLNSFDIKYTSMKLTKRYIELETKTDAESVREFQRINNKFEELDDRLKVLLENIMFK